MTTEAHFISITTLCSHYEIGLSFVDSLNQMGLIQIEMIEEDRCIHRDRLSDLEKIIRLHYDLNVNLEGIDVVFNLLEKERALRDELTMLRNRLRLYEGE